MTDGRPASGDMGGTGAPAPVSVGEAPPARDPSRGLRAIGAALLVMHAIVVALAIPVVVHRDSGSSTAGVAGLTAIAVLDIVVAGLLRRAEKPAIVTGSVLLALTIVAGLLSGFLLFVGVVFGALWVGWLGMRRSLAAEVTAARRAPPGGAAAPATPPAAPPAAPDGGASRAPGG